MYNINVVILVLFLFLFKKKKINKDLIRFDSFADDIQLQMSAPQIEYLTYFTLCSHVLVMSKLGQLRTCLNLMTARQNS